MKPFEVFKIGNHRDSKGRAFVATAAMLAAMATNFNADLAGSPLIIGHAEESSPAYGWVDKFTVQGDRLMAHPKQAHKDFEEMVETGRFPNRSISLYAPTDPNNPVQGSYYPRHIAFLGAAAPAIKGLKPVEFSQADDLYEFTLDTEAQSEGMWATNPVDAIALALLKVFGLGKPVMDFAQATPSTPLKHHQFRGQASPTPEEDIMNDKEKIKFAEQQSALEDERAKLDADKIEFATLAAMARASEDAAFIEQLEADGKVPPTLKPSLVEFMTSLADDETAPIEFSQADGKTNIKQTQRKFFTDLLSGANAQINFSEVSAEDADDEAVDMDDANVISAKAVEFQQVQAGLGVDIPFDQAVAHVVKSAS